MLVFRDKVRFYNRDRKSYLFARYENLTLSLLQEVKN